MNDICIFCSSSKNCFYIQPIKDIIERNIDIPNKIKILLIPLCEKGICNLKRNKKNVYETFLENITSKNIRFPKNVNGIFFYTPEEFPRGDFSDSIYNQSRMIRNFFENTTYAKTANYRNILEKLKELIVEIKEDKEREKNNKQKKKKNSNEAVKILNQFRDIFKNNQFRDIFKNSKNDLKELSQIYTYQSFHIKGTHGNLRKFSEFLQNLKSENNFAEENIKNHILDFKKDYYIGRQKHDIASIVANNPLRFEFNEEPLKIFVIDDNPEIGEDFKKIISLLPNNSEIWLTEKDEYKKFINQPEFIQNLYNNKDELKLKNIAKKDNTGNVTISDGNFEVKSLFKDSKDKIKFEFDYIIVDLLLGSYNEGNKIIRELVKFRHFFHKRKFKNEEGNAIFHILVYSLSDDVEDIYRAFEEGGLGYVWKFGRIYSLPALIAQLEESRQQLVKDIGLSKFAKGKARNFFKLYSLLPQIQLKLNTEAFLPYVPKNKNELEIEELAKDVARNWIKMLPKAELHYHIGDSVDENIVFYVAANELFYIEKRKINKIVEKIKEDLKRFIKCSKGNNDDFYKRFFYDLFFNPINEAANKANDRKEVENSITELYKVITKDYKEEYKSVADYFLQIHPDIEKVKQYIEKCKNNPAELYFECLTYVLNKDISEPDKRISKDEVIIVFLVMIGLLEGREIEEAKDYFDNIRRKIDELKNELEELKDDENNEKYPGIKNLLTIIKEKFKPKISPDEEQKEIIEMNQKIRKEIENITGILKENKIFKGKELVWSLIKAPDDCTSLAALFRGDSFNGKLLLKRYENIFGVVYYLVTQAAEENIRYIEIRVAPSGYLNEEMDIIRRVIKALTDAADFTSLYLYLKEKKFIWVNYITTLKRHKDPYGRTQEIASAIIYREREKEKLSLDIIHPDIPYKWQPSKIVGVDLCGPEKDHPPSLFIEDFMPIFKVCSFVTVHAGEETSPQYTWEAIYKLHANRIGHGLSIAEFPSLMELLRDTQVCIELCPTSNEKTGFSGERKKKYPFFKYLLNGLNVTINTDDKGIIRTTLSDEYVKAAEFFYFSEDNSGDSNRLPLPLTKWEVLRLIKAGFNAAFISRDEKRELLKNVEEEIYKKILNYYEIEPM